MHHNVAFVEFLPVVDIGLVVAAMIALTILAGVWLIAAFGAKLFGWIPLVGGQIGGAFESAARFAQHAMGSVLDGTLHALSWSWNVIVRMAEDLWNELRAGLSDLANLGQYIKQVVIPALDSVLRLRIDQVNRELRFYVYATAQYLLQRIDQVNRLIRALIAAEVTYLRDRIDQVNRELRADLLRVWNYLEWQIATEVKALTARMDALFHKSEADAIAGDAATLATAIATSIADIDTEARDTASIVWAGIESELSNLEHVIGSDFPELLRLLQDVPTVAPAGLAAALAVSLRFMQPVAKVTADCTIPTCRDLGPLRNLLHLLADAGLMALLLAWLVFCVTDPEAAAQDTATVMDPIAGAVLQPLIDLLGAA